MSVNLSARQFEQEDLVESITSIIRNTGTNPSNLRLEVTETSVMRDPEKAISKMIELKEKNKGVRIAIDDFGTGYSSLGYLSHFPVDTLKIDKSFVSNLYESNNTKIINAIIALGHSLDMDIIAEGVETKEQSSYLDTMNCETLQGYYYRGAVPQDEIEKLLGSGGKIPGAVNA